MPQLLAADAAEHFIAAARGRSLDIGGHSAVTSNERRAGVRVTLATRYTFIRFTPMLHEDTTGDLEPAQICKPHCKLLWGLPF